MEEAPQCWDGKRWVPISGYGYTVAEVSAMQEAMACGCVAGESGGCVLCGVPTRWPLPEYASAEERVEKRSGRGTRARGGGSRRRRGWRGIGRQPRGHWLCEYQYVAHVPEGLYISLNPS